MVTFLDNPLWIPVIPCAAALINFIFGRQLASKTAWVSSIATLLCFTLSIPLFMKVLRDGPFEHSGVWLDTGSLKLTAGFLMDPFSAVLLPVVSLVGTLIQIYAAGYMKNDEGFARFFTILSLFMAAMTLLVIADGLLLFFMAWEVMGLCSYLLIGFWFHKESASRAAQKAFITTRLGDMGLLFGMLMVLVSLGTLQFSAMTLEAQRAAPSVWLSAAALLIFAGTVGKSAQFPLHIWLPDAMEGPTPVSALIHAATMVAAGVYLLIRTFPILALNSDVLFFIACTGTLTALISAVFALRSQEMKRTLAFSTISQLGFMTASIGFSNPAAAMFHLITHAFFKALLFMGAGSVLHACGTQNVKELGGLSRAMRTTSASFLTGTLALAGLPPLAGFWSKESILAGAQMHSGFFCAILLLTSLLTALYSLRLYLDVFSGSERSHAARNAHEGGMEMTLPLVVLAFFSVTAGLPGSPWFGHSLQNFLQDAHASVHPSVTLLLGSLTACAVGFAVALFSRKPSAARFLSKASPIGGFIEKAGLDIPNTAADLSDAGLRSAGSAVSVFDRFGIDSAVMTPGIVMELFAAAFRKIQSGFVQHYLLIAFVSIIGLLTACLCF